MAVELADPADGIVEKPPRFPQPLPKAATAGHMGRSDAIARERHNRRGQPLGRFQIP